MFEVAEGTRISVVLKGPSPSQHIFSERTSPIALYCTVPELIPPTPAPYHFFMPVPCTNCTDSGGAGVGEGGEDNRHVLAILVQSRAGYRSLELGLWK